MALDQYKHTGRQGIRSSTSPNPRTVEEDISYKVKELSPESVPLLTLGSKLLKGAKPKNHKVEVTQYYSFDDFDYMSASAAGTAETNNSTRYGRVTIDQISRPATTGMYYAPQDRFYIVATGQEVEVLITQDACIKQSGSEAGLASNIVIGSGGTGIVTRTNPGELVVKTVQPVAFRTFTGSDCIFLGRTIHEGQSIEATGRQRDVVFDYNLVEHKEAVLQFTETQSKMYKSKLAFDDFTFQQRETTKEFKQSIDKVLTFGERAWDTQSGYPKPSMGGFVSTIKTNVANYSPSTITNYEDLVQNFMFDQAFRYNPNGWNKIALCGSQFLRNFSNAFREYRRTTNLKVTEEAGMNMDTYVIPGGMNLMFARTETFRQGTPLENWCMVIDPSCAELRVAKEFETGNYTQTNERIESWMIEWQGTISFHNEQAHSILKAY